MNASVKRPVIHHISHGSFHILAVRLVANLCNQNVVTNVYCFVILVHVRHVLRWYQSNAIAVNCLHSHAVAMPRIGAVGVYATRNTIRALILVKTCVMLANVHPAWK
jgi:uncharacterized membrane protein YesL